MTTPKDSNVDERLETMQKMLGLALPAAWVCMFLGFGPIIWGCIAVSKSKKGGFSLDALAQVGSFWQGSAAAIWALGGLLLIFTAYLAQKEQLIRQEIAFKKQEDQFELQQESIRRQNFENTFFQLLNLHHEIVNGFRLVTFGQEVADNGTVLVRVVLEGRLCLDTWDKSLRKTFAEKRFLSRQMNAQDQSAKCYEAFFTDNKGALGHYFTNLYHLVKFVSDSDIKDKQRYTNLIRAQLSQHELMLLFYNCVSPVGKKFKPLVEEFALLHTFDESKLLDQSHYGLYDKAYGEQNEQSKPL